MKINSIGINTYRQMTERPAANRQPAEIETNKPAEPTGKINIPVQKEKINSDLGVRVSGSKFTEMLSAEEKKAFELVFEKFNANKANGNSGQDGLGRFVDVRL